MRRALAAFAITLAGCGGQAPGDGAANNVVAAGPDGSSPLDAFFAGEPRVALPIKAPEGAPPEIADFLEVCSRAIVDQAQGVSEASKRGWQSDPSQLATAALAGMVVMTRSNEVGASQMLQINQVRFPHLTGSSCMINQYLEGVPAALPMETMTGISGLRGAQLGFPPGLTGGAEASRGGYSLVTPDGDLVTLQIVFAPPTLLNMTMAMSRPVLPKDADPK